MEAERRITRRRRRMKEGEKKKKEIKIFFRVL